MAMEFITSTFLQYDYKITIILPIIPHKMYYIIIIHLDKRIMS